MPSRWKSRSARAPVGPARRPPALQCGVLTLTTLLLVSCGTASQTTPTPSVPARELINPGDILSDASRYADLVFTAGHLPDDASAGIDEQVESALTNLERTLQAAGAGFDTLLQVNVYLADWDDWESFNAIYVRRIGQYGLPPRTTVDIDRLGFDSLIEIEAVAHVRAAPSARP